ncbi:alpha/beta-hydrolase [Pholiota conissans]|uniref:Alpha/beta-hydrolase n=1 Tax=Pholiota conissans TaxID=109636 RepID=A0A9P5YU15_9AGAR|nr:alpha/beta-hydrolase [Pholiota conissans]
MPQVKIESPSGPALIHYTISTPKDKNADKIDPSLPTIIFLHPIYVSQIIFHYQFASPEVRRFNLVALDARLHGGTVGDVPPAYRCADAAHDIAAFMDALGLPACHFFGVSFGSITALQLGVEHPEKVLSLFLMSPIPWIEPELAADGRQEIYDCWVEGHKDPNNPDESASLDAVFGGLELAYNGSTASIVSAVVQYTVPRVVVLWSPENFEAFHTISVKFFVERSPCPPEKLKKITCPVNLIHCAEDIAYPMPLVEEIRDRLEEAGVDVRISQIPDAPHFGCVTHPELTNELFMGWMMSAIGDAVIPPAKAHAFSPYEADLVQCGLKSQESDSEDEFMVVP